MFPVSTGRGIDAPSRCARLPTWWAADTSGYRFEALPDGIALDANGNGHHVDVYVNHETSTVPFPYNPQNPTAANGENDFNNSQVSKLSLDFNDGVISVEEAEIVSGTEFGYQRFCSSYLATEKEGSTGRSSSRTRRPSSGSTPPGRPGRPRRAPREHVNPELGFVEVERHRRCLGGVRPGRVPG